MKLRAKGTHHHESHFRNQGKESSVHIGLFTERTDEPKLVNWHAVSEPQQLPEGFQSLEVPVLMKVWFVVLRKLIK